MIPEISLGWCIAIIALARFMDFAEWLQVP